MNRNALFIFFISALLLCIHACQERDRQAVAIVASDTLTYVAQIDQSQLLITEVSVKGIISLQKIIVYTTIKNAGSSSVKINPMLAELHCRNETRSTPVTSSSTADHLAPNESAALTFEFDPVQSGFLYQQSGLRGDLDKSYTLIIHALAGDNEMISKEIFLKTDSLNLTASIDSFGIADRIKPFIIADVTDDIEEKLNAAITAVNLTVPHEGLRISDNEILSKGFWIKFTAIHKQDTLFVKLRMVNQSSQVVGISVPSFELSIQERTIQLVNPHKNEKLILRNGDRGETMLKFPVPLLDGYVLNMNGVRFEGNGEPVIGQSLIFRPLMLTTKTP
jgi:hypothetical protein